MRCVLAVLEIFDEPWAVFTHIHMAKLTDRPCRGHTELSQRSSSEWINHSLYGPHSCSAMLQVISKDSTDKSRNMSPSMNFQI